MKLLSGKLPRIAQLTVSTLRAPANTLREVNRALEEAACSGYQTEFDTTYRRIAEENRSRHR